MNEQPTGRRRAGRAAGRSLALAVGVAALVALLGAGHALAALAPPDERVLERQRRRDHYGAPGQADQPGKAQDPSQGSPAGSQGRFIRPEPPVGAPAQLDEPLAPTPVPAAPARGRGGPVVTVVVAAALLMVGAATTWRVRQRRPQPGPTA
jgi:hypothetical protein